MKLRKSAGAGKLTRWHITTPIGGEARSEAEAALCKLAGGAVAADPGKDAGAVVIHE